MPAWLETLPGMLAFFGIFSATAFLFPVWLQGRRSRGGNIEENALHRIWIKLFLGALFVGVLGIEIMVRKSGGWWDTSWLAVIHMMLVFCITFLFIAIYFFRNGLKRPDVHAKMAYFFIACYILTLGTGTALLARYPG